MNKLILMAIVAFSALLQSGFVDASHAKKGNAIWLYDATYPNGPDKKANIVPGYWTDWLTSYNQGAKAGSEIKTVFTYGGDIELYGRGAGESDPSTPLDATNTFVYYTDSSKESVKKYKNVDKVENIMPIVDGRVDSWLLWPLNPNLDNVADVISDKIAANYLTDENVAGIQVDLEPFNIDAQGQSALYQDLNKKFQSSAAKSDKYPSGRFYSNFFFPSKISDSQWEKIQAGFKGQGFLVISGYDLGTGQPGTPESPEQYAQNLKKEITIMIDKASQYDLDFMVGLPASASTYEFEVFQKEDGTTVESGYKQLDYVMAALGVAKELNLRQNPHFVGFSVWGLSTEMAYPPHSLNLFYPNTPPKEVIEYLQQNL